MLRFFENAKYDFIGKWRIAVGVTLAFVIPGLILFAVRGLNESIEFTGGTLLQVHSNTPALTTGVIRSALAARGISGAEIQTFGGADEFVIRARLDPKSMVSEEAGQQTGRAVSEALTAAVGAGGFEIVRTEAVGPKVGAELRERAVLALALSFGAIFLILWLRYEWRFGLAAVIATFHDIFGTLAFLSYLNLEVSLIIVAAFLTLVGYSLNDTIVTFDRVRENIKKAKREDFVTLLNRSINEVIPRTTLTAGTTAAAVLALLILGGAVIRPFAWVMTFGVVTGVFSSMFIACPVLLWLERRWPAEDVRGAKGTVPKGAPATT